jgi:hypothetical protein
LNNSSTFVFSNSVFVGIIILKNDFICCIKVEIVIDKDIRVCLSFSEQGLKFSIAFVLASVSYFRKYLFHSKLILIQLFCMKSSIAFQREIEVLISRLVSL